VKERKKENHVHPKKSPFFLGESIPSVYMHKSVAHSTVIYKTILKKGMQENTFADSFHFPPPSIDVIVCVHVVESVVKRVHLL